MDIFDYGQEKGIKKSRPLAARMRPKTLDDYIGQSHIIGENTLLRRSIVADNIMSLILYGPPGVGKTTLAQVIANSTNSYFVELSAVTSGISDIKRVVAEAKDRLSYEQCRTILFIDEIHRFNKSQQDALLPAVEDGVVIFIGATTENPYFEVNSALISRARIYKLQPLNETEIATLINRAVADKDNGLGIYKINISSDAINHLAMMCGGDARQALNGLEMAVLSTLPGEDSIRHIDLATVEESIQQRAIKYDKTGDMHYDIISAFIKSIRGSDPDATLHYLARMIEAGEDPKFIARRIIISAAEDVGLADPNALNVAVSCFNAINFIGMPEGRIVLSEAALYMAIAPKSNAAYVGIDSAIADVRKKDIGEVPPHLRDSHYKGASALGHGRGYKYPHDYPGHVVRQQYLPDKLLRRVYYEPSDNGKEKKVKEWLKKLKSLI